MIRETDERWVRILNRKQPDWDPLDWNYKATKFVYVNKTIEYVRFCGGKPGIVICPRMTPAMFTARS